MKYLTVLFLASACCLLAKAEPPGCKTGSKIYLINEGASVSEVIEWTSKMSLAAALAKCDGTAWRSVVHLLSSGTIRRFSERELTDGLIVGATPLLAPGDVLVLGRINTKRAVKLMELPEVRNALTIPGTTTVKELHGFEGIVF